MGVNQSKINNKSINKLNENQLPLAVRAKLQFNRFRAKLQFNRLVCLPAALFKVPKKVMDTLISPENSKQITVDTPTSYHSTVSDKGTADCGCESDGIESCDADYQPVRGGGAKEGNKRSYANLNVAVGIVQKQRENLVDYQWKTTNTREAIIQQIANLRVERPGAKELPGRKNFNGDVLEQARQDAILDDIQFLMSVELKGSTATKDLASWTVGRPIAEIQVVRGISGLNKDVVDGVEFCSSVDSTVFLTSVRRVDELEKIDAVRKMSKAQTQNGGVATEMESTDQDEDSLIKKIKRISVQRSAVEQKRISKAEDIPQRVSILITPATTAGNSPTSSRTSSKESQLV